MGAGVGLLGLHCLRINSIKHYTFTDCHRLVLKQIEKNVLHNYNKEFVLNAFDSDEKEIKYLENDKLISINRLDWTDLNDTCLFENKNNTLLDVILATGKIL